MLRPVLLHGFTSAPSTRKEDVGEYASTWTDPRYRIAFVVVLLVLIVSTLAFWKVWHELDAVGRRPTSEVASPDTATEATGTAEMPSVQQPTDNGALQSSVFSERPADASPIAPRHAGPTPSAVVISQVPVREVRKPERAEAIDTSEAPELSVASAEDSERLRKLTDINPTPVAVEPPLARDSTERPKPVRKQLSIQEVARLLHEPPQHQAEDLLQAAIDGQDPAVKIIEAHVNMWRGKITWSPRLAQIDLVARRSADASLRVATIEAMLAAYEYTKEPKTVERLVRLAHKRPAARLHALDALARLGNRGVQQAQVIKVLEGYAYDADPATQQMAIEGLSLVGTQESLSILSRMAAEGNSSTQREKAAHALALAPAYGSTERAVTIRR